MKIVDVLNFNTKIEPIVTFLQNASFLIGLGFSILKFRPIIEYFRNKAFSSSVDRIKSDLEYRSLIESKLGKYVLEKHENGIKGAGIRFVYWKNYPSKLENDAYKHNLWAEYDDTRLIYSSWINNTGLYFQESLWYTSTSAYVDDKGIFFFDKPSKGYKGFTEHKNKCLVFHLPFSNIVNFDFEEIIEYEPVFYIKFKYNDFKNLYDPIYILRNRMDDNYFRLELDSSKEIKKYSKFHYAIIRIKHWFY